MAKPFTKEQLTEWMKQKGVDVQPLGWWEDFITWLEDIFGGGDDKHEWQLGITVHPADARVVIESQGMSQIAADDAGGHKHIRFASPPFTQNAAGTLLVEAEGYTSSTTPLPSIGPEAPGDGSQPNFPELNLVTLERDVLIPPPIEPAGPLTRLRINGKFFEEQDGTPHVRIATSDFGLIRLMAEGADIIPVLQERRAMGFNELRVFSMMCGSLGRLLPTEIPNYYTELLPEFLTMAEREGLRVELTALVDAHGGAAWEHRTRIDHYEQVKAILEARENSPHFLERVNENDQHMNATDMSGFRRPVGVFGCSGSYGADLIPYQFVEQWDYGVLHPARPPDWVRKVVHNPMEDVADHLGIPGSSNENCRPDQGRGPIESDFFDAGAGSSLLHNGGTFHSECGKFSRLYAENETERRCAEAYIRGAKAVPLSYRYGDYMAGHLHDMPIESHPTGPNDPLVWNSRAYARLTGGTSCAVVCQATEAFEVKPLNGWRIVQQIESVFLCERP